MRAKGVWTRLLEHDVFNIQYPMSFHYSIRSEQRHSLLKLHSNVFKKCFIYSLLETMRKKKPFCGKETLLMIKYTLCLKVIYMIQL